MEAVFDIEANGLLEESTEIHCIVIKGVGDNVVHKFWDNPSILHLKNPENERHHYLDKQSILSIFLLYDKIICHNLIRFDIGMLLKFYNINLYDHFKMENIVDTFVWSQCLNPDREMPKGCPTTITPPPHLRSEGFKTKRVGPHGLESWGYRTGVHKPAIHDWRSFNPGILHRCVEDVKINEAAYLLLKEEANVE